MFIVAIDGPAGTGKSSLSRYLAQILNFIYVDTGAIYRALAFLVEKYEVDPKNSEEVVALIPKILIEIDEKSHSTKIMLDDQLMENELRTEEMSKLSSLISQHQKVRKDLLPVQRALIKKISSGAIFEGRDIGTVVFPFAHVKIFITANSETRALRRFREIKDKHPQASFEQILLSIKKRDERDIKRENAPMQQAEDAQVIDTSKMTFDEVTHAALNLIKVAQKKFTTGSKLW
jgi:CMP/dCMP kinase